MKSFAVTGEPSEYFSPSRSVKVYVRPSDDSVGFAFAAAGIGFSVLGSNVMRASKTCIVCATSLTNDSFCGSIVSGSEPVLVVISPLASRFAPPGDAVVFPGVLVHAVAMSPAIMSRDRSDHKPLLRRMHCLLAKFARPGNAVRKRGCAVVEAGPTFPSGPPPSVPPAAPWIGKSPGSRVILGPLQDHYQAFSAEVQGAVYRQVVTFQVSASSFGGACGPSRARGVRSTRRR